MTEDYYNKNDEKEQSSAQNGNWIVGMFGLGEPTSEILPEKSDMNEPNEYETGWLLILKEILINPNLTEEQRKMCLKTHYSLVPKSVKNTDNSSNNVINNATKEYLPIFANWIEEVGTESKILKQKNKNIIHRKNRKTIASPRLTVRRSHARAYKSPRRSKYSIAKGTGGGSDDDGGSDPAKPHVNTQPFALTHHKHNILNRFRPSEYTPWLMLHDYRLFRREVA